MPLASISSLDRLTDAQCLALRERFTAHGYTSDLLNDTERVAPRQFDAVRLPLVHWWLEQRRDHASRLTQLFAYDAPVWVEEVRAALGELTEPLIECGVLVKARVPEQVTSAYRVMPVDELWVWSDPLENGADVVMGPGATTVQMMRMMPPGKRRRVLDVGCGAGSLALFAARVGHEAVGTDVNPRAVAMARFNARFNGLEAEFLAGDVTQPVAGRSFDQVVAQPPFVMQPEDAPRLTWLHGGSGGEDLTRRLLRELPPLLDVGGRALLLVDAPVTEGDVLHERYREALGDTELDLIVLASPGSTTDLHAVAYGALERKDLGEEYAGAVRRYRGHFDRLGVREFRRCAVIVRRPEPGRDHGPITATVPVRGLPADAATLERLLRGLGAAGSPDATLLTVRARPAAGGRWILQRSTLDREEEPKYRAEFDDRAVSLDRELSAATMVLLESLAQADSVAGAIVEFARRCEAKPEEVRDAAIQFVRQGLATGLVECADDGVPSQASSGASRTV